MVRRPCAGASCAHISNGMKTFFRIFPAVGLMAVLALTTAPDGLSAADAENDSQMDVVLNAVDTTLADWLWIKRPIVVFADNAADPRFNEQVALLLERYEALEERDVVIIIDSDPSAQSSVRKALRPRGFSLVVMAKDGTIVTRKPRPWSVREISRAIDKLPMRLDELKGF